MKKIWQNQSLLIFLAQICIIGLVNGQVKNKEYYVYQYVVESATGEFDEICSEIEVGALEAGWRVLAEVDCGAPKGCEYQSRVFVLYDSAYAHEIMGANRKTGPFAVVDRINIFQDENGTHVSMVNPHSVNRTVLMEDIAHEEMNEEHLLALRQMITEKIQGTISTKEYGQKRKKGHIGKTMGVMAGGKFVDKIKDEAVIPDGDWREVAAKVREGLSQAGPKWGMHLVYELELPEYETMIFGSTGSPMDGKSFSIVKAGSDKSRKSFKCPGLAHAAAYPIEVVVANEDDGVKVRLVHTMYRMKMYFEDAGKWTFMKNMGMPGSIEDELKKQFKEALVPAKN